MSDPNTIADAIAQGAHEAAWAYVWRDPILTITETLCWIIGAPLVGAGLGGALWLVVRLIPNPNRSVAKPEGTP